MNERQYLDYFPELKGLPHEEQLSRLGSARYKVFVTDGLAGRAALLMCLSFMVALAVASVPLLVGIKSILATALAIGAGVFLGLWLHKRLYGKLLRKGLR